jgi:hypothetical protein
MSTEQDRDRMIERVRKCLALSKSPNEHEAAAALRQAQKLMAAYNITESDVGLAEYIDAHVDHQEYEHGGKKPIVIEAVISIVNRAFGVTAVWEAGFDQSVMDNKPWRLKYWHRVRYFGRKSNVMLAVHSHQVVYRALLSSWRRHCKDHPWAKSVRHGRASFAYGWCSAVQSKLEDLRPVGDEADKIKAKKAQRYGTSELAKSELGTKNVDRNLAMDGHTKGQEFNINRPVGTERNRLEKLR